MLLRTKGNAYNISEPLIGRVSRNPAELDENTFLILEDSNQSIERHAMKGVLASFDFDYAVPKVNNVPNFEHLEDGDIVVANQDGNINTLYRVNSFHNVLLATERCNSNCLMCSQPPKNREDVSRLYEINSKLIELIPKDCFELGISGGEPTLMGSLFFELLDKIKKQLPDTEIHVLSNGRSFAWNNMAERLAELDCSRLMIGIPLYSDYYQMHDYIVQAKDAFNQTVLGIHNLGRYNQRIEIRIVLHKLSIPRLMKLAKYIYKNLPFVEHIAFMGLEYIGYTPHNIDKLWIDPYEYQGELEEAVEFLASKRMYVSIYNSQLCVMPENLWKYARRSISDWKNSYLPECQVCDKLAECGGLFTWNLQKHSHHIKPLIC